MDERACCPAGADNRARRLIRVGMPPIKTASTLGLTIVPSPLARADQASE